MWLYVCGCVDALTGALVYKREKLYARSLAYAHTHTKAYSWKCSIDYYILYRTSPSSLYNLFCVSISQKNFSIRSDRSHSLPLPDAQLPSPVYSRRRTSPSGSSGDICDPGDPPGRNNRQRLGHTGRNPHTGTAPDTRPPSGHRNRL